MSDTLSTHDDRFVNLARRVFATAGLLLGRSVAPEDASDRGDAVRPSTLGLSLSGVPTGLDALRAGKLGAAWRFSDLPIVEGRVADSIRGVLEAEGHDDLCAKLAPLVAQSDAGLEDAARAGLTAATAWEVVYLPPGLKRSVSRAVAGAYLLQASRAVADGEHAAALDALREATLLCPKAAWVHEAALSLAWIAQEDGADEETVHGALRLLEMRLEACALDEVFYVRLFRVLSRAGHEPKAAIQALLAGIASATRDLAAPERLAHLALTHLPTDARASRFAGTLCFFEGDFEGAIPHLRRATEGGEKTALLLGLAELETGDRQTGLERLAALTAGEHPQRDALLACARAAYATGEKDAALELLASVEQCGEPYRSRASTLRAQILLDRGDVDAAHDLMFEAPDACEDDAIRMFERLAEVHRERDDDARHAQAAKEAADMAALPPARRRYGFITNPMGHPAALSVDPGGAFYLGVDRKTGRQVLWRLRVARPDEARVPPARVTSPFFLAPLAQDISEGRLYTVYRNPFASPLSALLAAPERLAERRRDLVISLAAALGDAAAVGACVGWLIPERVLVAASGSPALVPFDRLDDPRKEGPAYVKESVDLLAPEVRGHGADAASPASDIYAFGALAPRILGDLARDAWLDEVLAACRAADPAARPGAAEVYTAALHGL